MVDIDSFSIIDCETLMAKAYMPIQFIVENLFAPGLHILAGAPKAGKSWMVLPANRKRRASLGNACGTGHRILSCAGG